MKELSKVFLNSPIYWTVIILLIVFAIFIKIYYSKIIGWFGEHWVKQELKKLPKDKYKVLNDIMILTNRGTCQIDHLVISIYGIFVIETKQYNGYITGDKYDKKWIRHLGRRKMYYENPIRQNYGHVKSICELLNLDESRVFNIVCVPSLHVKLNITHNGELTNNKTIVERITSFQNIVINNIDEIEKIILDNNIVDRDKRKEHVKVVRNNIETFDSNMCPKCGGTLVERKGQYGSFIGCSNYPKCKYTKKF